MQQKYAYSFNGIVQWFRGFTMVPELGTKLVYPYKHPGQTFVWRNDYAQSYKVSNTF
jgi:hypothetical protein